MSLRDRLMPTSTAGRARARRPPRYRFSAWTFVAPVALVACVIVVMSVASDIVRDSPKRSTGAQTSSTASSQATATAATTGAVATTTPASIPKRYRVQDGDTLDGIANRFGVPVETLIELNPKVDPLKLQPGQRIRLR